MFAVESYAKNGLKVRKLDWNLRRYIFENLYRASSYRVTYFL